MVQPDWNTGSLKALEPFHNQLLGQFCHHRLELRHALSGEIGVQWLSALAVEIVACGREMGTLEVDDAADETFIAVCWADGASDVEFVVVLVVADGEFVRVDPDNWAYNFKHSKLTMWGDTSSNHIGEGEGKCGAIIKLGVRINRKSRCTHRICHASFLSQKDTFLYP